MPWKPAATSDLERKVHALQMTLLRVNSELRLKTIYAKRLEVLLHQRNERIDQLYGLLELARQRNHRLEQECEHFARMVANGGQPSIAAPDAR